MTRRKTNKFEHKSTVGNIVVISNPTFCKARQDCYNLESNILHFALAASMTAFGQAELPPVKKAAGIWSLDYASYF